MKMPSRNLLRVDIPDGYYHVYTRGVNSRTIFKEQQDYTVFLALLKRYLSMYPAKDKNGVEYAHLYKKLELLSFCLMPNHLHLLVFQIKQGSLQQLMHGVMLSYSKYFNRKYHRRGPLFESRYKASLINNDAYLQHISRYIHLNPESWKDYEYSSLPYYIGDYDSEWLLPDRILELFKSAAEYQRFLKDYVDYKRTLDVVKKEMAAL